MSQPQPIGGQAGKYHWWYDSKAAGVRNAPGMGQVSSSPPLSPSGQSADGQPRRFSLTSGFSNASPPDSARPRRDSLKNMFHLSDFGSPGT